MYAWLGNRAGVALAKELWAEPCDYSDCDINPILSMVKANLPILKLYELARDGSFEGYFPTQM